MAPPVPWRAPDQALLAVAGALLATSLILGGGGTPAPLAEAAVEAAALAALAIAVMSGLRPLSALRRDPPLFALTGAIVLLPLIQLVPLPPGIWQALPGREGVTAALNGEAAWRGWSLQPDATLAAALALLPPVVMLMLTAALSPGARVRLIVLLTALALAAAVLGLVQFARGPDLPLTWHDEVHRGWAIGFFANRNAQADLVAIGLVAGLLLVRRHRARLTAAALLALTIAGVVALAGGVATGSRMGLIVLAVPVALGLAQAGRRAPAVAATLAGVAALLLVGGTALDRVVARAGDPGNRVDIWGDSLFVARSVAPVGGGMGSFPTLHAAAERLDQVQPTVANRAHNDWLELAIEGGAPALLLLAAALAFVARRAASAWRDADPDRRLLARFAGLTALILAVHSVVDYPLRNLALLTVAGVALGGLASGRARPHNTGRAGQGAGADA